MKENQIVSEKFQKLSEKFQKLSEKFGMQMKRACVRVGNGMGMGGKSKVEMFPANRCMVANHQGKKRKASMAATAIETNL